MASIPEEPPPWTVWAAVVAVVGALWTALRASISSELRFAKGELKAERESHAVTRTERNAERAKLEAEQAARRADNERSARALLEAWQANQADDGWRESAPTGVRNILAVAAPPTSHVDRLLKEADEQPVARWSTSLPPAKPPRGRPR